MLTSTWIRARALARAHPWRTTMGALAVLIAATVAAAVSYVEREDIPEEARRLVDEVGLDRAESVADVGAGTGRLTVALWRELRARGASTRMWATELDPARLELLRRAADEAGADIVVQAGAATSTALADSCCDVIVMRTVYHHVGHPTAMSASLHRALKPRGRLVIIEFAPVGPLRWAHVEGAAKQRRGHGVPRAELERELAAAGFRPVKELRRWHPMLYAVVFERVDEATRYAPAR